MLLRAAQFQAAWYFTLLLAVMLLLVGVGAFYALRGARRMWREGERGAAAAIAAGVGFGVLALLAMYAVGLGVILVYGKST